MTREVSDLENFCTKPAPFGERSLTVSVSGFRFRFGGLDDRILGLLAGAYGLFVEEEPRSAAFEVAVGLAGGSSRAAGTDLEMSSSKGFSLLLAPYFSAARRDDLSKGFLHLHGTDDGSVVFAAENFMRWMLSRMAPEKGGLLLHASAKAIEGKAHVFLGPHESGKSTAVSLISEGATIADDVLLVLPGTLGYVAAAMPAAKKFEQRREEIGFYPLAGFYRLLKDPSNSARRMPKAAAFAVLVSSCPFQGDFNRYLYIIRNLAEKVPVYDLRFRKEEGFFTEALGRGDGDD